MNHPRAECRYAESDSISGPAGPQLRLDPRHAGQRSPTLGSCRQKLN
jgi:hypothetical protein